MWWWWWAGYGWQEVHQVFVSWETGSSDCDLDCNQDFNYCSQQLSGEVRVVKKFFLMEVSRTFQGLIWFYGPTHFCSFNHPCNSPSSRPFLLFLLTYTPSKQCGPINASSMFSVGVCLQGERWESRANHMEGKESDKGTWLDDCCPFSPHAS